MKIKDWQKFQHFKNRRPPWIKLYRDLLDNPDWFDLDPLLAKTLVMLWLIASEDDQLTGELPSLKKISFRLRITEDELYKRLILLKEWVEEIPVVL